MGNEVGVGVEVGVDVASMVPSNLGVADANPELTALVGVGVGVSSVTRVATGGSTAVDDALGAWLAKETGAGASPRYRKSLWVGAMANSG